MLPIPLNRNIIAKMYENISKDKFVNIKKEKPMNAYSKDVIREIFIILLNI